MWSRFALVIADMSTDVVNDAAGFRVSNGTFNGLVQRYSYKDGKIHFDDFIHCVVRMKTMFGKPRAAPCSDGPNTRRLCYCRPYFFNILVTIMLKCALSSSALKINEIERRFLWQKPSTR